MNKIDSSQVLYEDNHIIAVNKPWSVLVQGDKTGDECLLELVKTYIKDRDDKPGNVFLGLIHRLDRPTSGIVLFAKTSKALSRMNKLFSSRDVEKVYWAVVDKPLSDPSGRIENYLIRRPKMNKSFAVKEGEKGAKRASLRYETLGASDRYTLLKVILETGRHHQIRAQLADKGVHIKGDLKYGAKRSNPSGGIHLHARYVSFIHPVSHKEISITANPPSDPVWNYFTESVG